MEKKRVIITFLLKNRLLFILFFIFTVSAIFLLCKNNISNAEAKSLKSRPQIIVHRQFRPVCADHIKGAARCHAHVITDNSGNPLGSGSPLSSSFGPVQFHTVYNLPCSPGGGARQSVCPTPLNNSFGLQTIAIVDAYNAPNIESDLNTYNSNYGLPSCTSANGCLKIVNENGGSTLPMHVSSGWALETSLDVEVAHMICQTCKILLVESNSSYYSDLGTAVNTAARLGANEISNSYGGSEWSSETYYDSTYYNHPGIAITASSGDSGYGTEFPAASPNVVAIGGTTLQVSTTNNYIGETVWNGTGSGCSTFEKANPWQKNLSNWNQTNCGNNRAIADISADADPNTGAAVYDSTPYNGTTGWYQVGGTSLASPLIAGVYALAGGVSVNTNASSVPYAFFTASNFHDISVGSNGQCGTIMCNAGIGYDGPSGLGSPNWLGGFNSFYDLSPTPTLTPTAIPTQTPTPTVTLAPTLTSSPTPTGTLFPTSTPTSAPTIIPSQTPTPTPIQTFKFGYTTVGNSTDFIDENYIDGSRFKMGTTNGTLKSISVNVASVDSAPNNQYQVAIYNDNNGVPGSLLAKSSTGTLSANNWNTLNLSAPLLANTYYWLVYNTNSTSDSLNDLQYNNTSTFMGVYSSSNIAFGSWPQTFNSTLDGYEYSIYATYTSP